MKGGEGNDRRSAAHLGLIHSGGMKLTLIEDAAPLSVGENWWKSGTRRDGAGGGWGH